MNGLLDRIVQRRRASASSRLGPPNGAAPADPAVHASANGAVRAKPVLEAPSAPEPAPDTDPPATPDPPRAPKPTPPHTPESPPAPEQAPTSEPRQPPGRAAPSPPIQRATGAQPPGLRERSRIRRRTRFLRRMRQLQLRDIGGFMVELHRFGRDRPDLVKAKVEAAAKTDRELRALERALGEGRPVTDVREPGIGGACPACGTVHGSADRYCSWCGRDL